MIIVYVLFSLLALFGLFSLVRLAFLELYRVKNNFCNNYLVLCINEKNVGDIELETGIALSRLQWLSRREYDGVVIADCGLSKENHEICSSICNRFGFELIKIKEKDKSKVIL